MSAIDLVKETYIEESELAKFLGVAIERIRDLRSYHKTGRKKFIPYTSPTSRCHLYHVEDVMEYLNSSPTVHFNKSPD